MYGMLYSKVQLQTPVHGESCMVCYIVKFNYLETFELRPPILTVFYNVNWSCYQY